MSQRFFGTIPGQLASMLNVDGQRLLADHVNSEDGITLVYDIGQLIQGQYFENALRTAFATVDGGTPNTTVTIDALPLTYVIQKIQVSISSTVNVTAVALTAKGWGATGPTGGGDLVIWRWAAAGTTFPRVFGSETVFTLGTVLVPSFELPLPLIQRNISLSNFNQHVRGLELSVQTTTAVQVDVVCAVGLGFWSAPVGTPRSLTIVPNL